MVDSVATEDLSTKYTTRYWRWSSSVLSLHLAKTKRIFRKLYAAVFDSTSTYLDGVAKWRDVIGEGRGHQGHDERLKFTPELPFQVLYQILRRRHMIWKWLFQSWFSLVCKNKRCNFREKRKAFGEKKKNNLNLLKKKVAPMRKKKRCNFTRKKKVIFFREHELCEVAI